ncbi:MAG TPA: histidine kinase dimerization/phospho-acceptor domain-containing protein, partial [Yinghuangia sp.]|nr:histidine kinase dimerization/phospho-acceptor domain-containing protein [Yinghuangia sp.]
MALPGPRPSSCRASWDGQPLFIANAAHELRTPPATARTAIDVTLDGHPDRDELLAMAGDVRDAVEHMQRVLDGLLLARSQAGLTAREPADLAAITATPPSTPPGHAQRPPNSPYAPNCGPHRSPVNLLEPFVRGQGTRIRTDGLGLGLSSMPALGIPRLGVPAGKRFRKPGRLTVVHTASDGRRQERPGAEGLNGHVLALFGADQPQAEAG